MDIIHALGFIFFHTILLFALAKRGQGLFNSLFGSRENSEGTSVFAELLFFIITVIVAFLLFKYFLYRVYYKGYF